MSFRWEEDLRQSFLRHASPALWCPSPKPGPIHSAIESTCSEGRADWVWATLNASIPDEIDPVAFDLLQQPTCSRILAALRVRRRQSDDRLFSAAGVSRTTYRRFRRILLEAGLIRADATGMTRLGPAFQFPDFEICSFEFKLHDWRRALYQARRYRSFSHRVYVVMPPRPAQRILQQESPAFRRLNVGLIRHDNDGESARLIASRKRTPASPSHHIQAIGFLSSQGDSSPARLTNSENARPQLAR